MFLFNGYRGSAGALEIAKAIYNEGESDVFFFSSCLHGILTGTKDKMSSDYNLLTTASNTRLKFLLTTSIRALEGVIFHEPNLLEYKDAFITLHKLDNNCATKLSKMPANNALIRYCTDNLDFSFESLFYDPINNLMYDPFEGREALKEGVLITIDSLYERKVEQNPRKILKTLELSLDYNLKIPAVCNIVHNKKAGLLAQVPRSEKNTFLLECIQTSKGFLSLYENGIMGVLTGKHINGPYDYKYGKKGNEFTLDVVSTSLERLESSNRPRTDALMLAAVYSECGVDLFGANDDKLYEKTSLIVREQLTDMSFNDQLVSNTASLLHNYGLATKVNKGTHDDALMLIDKVGPQLPELLSLMDAKMKETSIVYRIRSLSTYYGPLFAKPSPISRSELALLFEVRKKIDQSNADVTVYEAPSSAIVKAAYRTLRLKQVQHLINNAEGALETLKTDFSLVPKRGTKFHKVTPTKSKIPFAQTGGHNKFN